MADAVELVAPLEVLVATSGRKHLDERVQVAVRLLGSLDEADRFVGHGADLGVGRPAELPPGRLEPLVDV